MFVEEYPESWPSFFKDLFDTLQGGPVMVDMFLRIVETIDRLVVATDTVRSTGQLAQNTSIVSTSCTKSLIT